MKTELCNFCLRSGILCKKCQEKLNSGKVSAVDLRIAHLLLSLEKRYPAIQNVHFYQAVETDNVLAIIIDQGNVPLLLGYGGKIVKALGEKTGKRIRILQHGVSERKFLEDLFAPLTILTINTIWLPDNTTETRVILKGASRIPAKISLKALKEVARKVRGLTLRIEFAR